MSASVKKEKFGIGLSPEGGVDPLLLRPDFTGPADAQIAAGDHKGQALGDFLVLPEDDLALAVVLKSPLFGLDDDDLLTLAPGRAGALWAALLAAATTAPRFAEAAALLEKLCLEDEFAEFLTLGAYERL
ncbi:MAG: hypothetical protein HC794_07950 [Nitrospiraceae bacterium]|nr:hypothetical protein [Nitrospiraceae bacterium]